MKKKRVYNLFCPDCEKPLGGKSMYCREHAARHRKPPKKAKCVRRPDETLAEYNRRRWAEVRKPIERAKNAGQRHCQFCGLMLWSRMAGARSQRYCEDCRKDPETRRYLRNLYMRRYNQKKNGWDVDSLKLAEEIT